MSVFSFTGLAQNNNPDEKYVPPAGSVFSSEKATEDIKSRKPMPKNCFKYDLGGVSRGAAIFEYELASKGDFSFAFSGGINFEKDLLYYTLGYTFNDDEDISDIKFFVMEPGFNWGLELKYWDDVYDGTFCFFNFKRYRYNLHQKYMATFNSGSSQSYEKSVSNYLTEQTTHLNVGFGQGVNIKKKILLEFSVSAGFCVRNTERPIPDFNGYSPETQDELYIHYVLGIGLKIGGLF